MTNIAVVILAAGKGTRMKNDSLPKVLVELAGKPLLSYVLDTAIKLNPSKIVLIVGHLKEKVIDYCETYYKDRVLFSHQDEQLGTGHAVMQAEKNLSSFDGNVLILTGDAPFVTFSTLNDFINMHNESDAIVSTLTAETVNPFGYGRIVRDNANNFKGIVEQKDATDEEKNITEINSGIYLADAKNLFFTLSNIENKNAQNEYYLTDIISINKTNGEKVNAIKSADFNEIQGINSYDELMNAENYLNSLLKK